jgi:glycosyltransferase involved in cell wall biosynthesis
VFITVLTCLFLLSVTIQIGYALYFFTGVFSLRSKKTIIKDKKPVSIVICAKNEAENLKRNLPTILTQRYKNEAGNFMYEVIVVNDASTDDTEQVLYELSQQYTHLWPVVVGQDAVRTLPGKKYPLSKAIPHASNDLLVLTDADCMPASEYWLEQMVAPLHAGKQVVAGYGKYRTEPGILNTFIRWETLHTFLQYSSYALAGKPYMAVGRNLACTKEAFKKAEQSDVWAKLPSGDDDLLVRTIASDHNVAIVANASAFTISDPKESFSAWQHQKQRHVSTGKYYRPNIIALLSGYACSHALMWLAFFTLLFIGDWPMVIGAMSFRCAIYWLLWHDAAKKLKEKKLALWFPLCDIGWMLYNFAFSPYIIWKNKRQWK